MNFKLWLENQFIRIIHKDGKGLMNNQALNYNKLDDDEYSDLEDQYLGLQQPPSHLHDKDVTFAFTPEGLQKHQNLISLLKKASKLGTKENTLNPNDYQIVWQSPDGQVALMPKTNIDEGFKDYLKAGIAGTALALAPNAYGQDRELTHSEKIAQLAKDTKSNKLYINRYVDDVLSSGINLFKNKSYNRLDDKYEIEVSTWSGGKKYASDGVNKGLLPSFEPKQDNPDVYEMTMLFDVKIKGDIKKLSESDAVFMAKKAVNDLNNLKDTILADFPYKPTLNQTKYYGSNKPIVRINKNTNTIEVSGIKADVQIPLYYKGK